MKDDDSSRDIAAAGADGSSSSPTPPPAPPKMKVFIDHLIADFGCKIQTRPDPRPIFKGADNEDGPLLQGPPHPPRLVSPSGGFISNIITYDDDEDVGPSLFQHFCDRLGLDPSEVRPKGPDCHVSTRPLAAARPKPPKGYRLPITRADGGRRHEQKKSKKKA